MEPVNYYPTAEEILFEGPSNCETCGRKFSNTSALRLHRVKYHRQILSNADRRLFSRDYDKTDPSICFHCPFESCQTKFMGMNNLRQHYMRSHTEKSLQCECGTRFVLEKDRKYHKKARCPLRPQEGGTAAKPKLQGKKKSKMGEVPPVLGQILPADGQQSVIIVIPSANVQETAKHIINALKTTSNVGIQASFPEAQPSTSTIAVGEETTQPPPEFSDFSGQYNGPMIEANEYYYQENTPEVRHISTGTDFAIPVYMNYPSEMADYGSFAYNQQSVTASVPIQNYPSEQPPTRSFGTTMDDFSTHVEREGEFDMLRDIETQTSTFWENLESSG